MWNKEAANCSEESAIFLFVDASVDPQTKIGFGAYLLCHPYELENFDQLKTKVCLRQFKNTSSTKLEIENLIWALSCISPLPQKVIVYTDSQTMVNLPERRQKLEGNMFRNKRGETLRNAFLYQEFFSIIDKVSIDLIKLKGHSRQKEKDTLANVFVLVDKASRHALKTYFHKFKAVGN